MNQSVLSFGSQFNDSSFGSSLKNEGSAKWELGSPGKNDIVDSMSQASDVMRSRWLAAATQLPTADQDDI